MAILAMAMFFRTRMPKDDIQDGGVYSGALFFAITSVMFNGASEMPLAVIKLPVFYKQRNMFFFPPWAYAIPAWIVKIPITVIEAGIWTCLTYYVIGFDPNVGR